MWFAAVSVTRGVMAPFASFPGPLLLTVMPPPPYAAMLGAEKVAGNAGLLPEGEPPT